MLISSGMEGRKEGRNEGRSERDGGRNKERKEGRKREKKKEGTINKMKLPFESRIYYHLQLQLF